MSIVPAKTNQDAYWDRMRNQCAVLYHRLMTEKRVSLRDMAEELGVSYTTVWRWMRSFTPILDLRIERGVAIIGDDLPHTGT